MSVLKNSELGIESFNFGQLVPDKGAKAIDPTGKFELKSLRGAEQHKNNLTEDGIRQERSYERNSAFEIAGYVKDHRGLNRQADEDYEIAVAAEVEKRIAEIREAAYQEGIEKGLAEGKEQAYGEAKVEYQKYVEDMGVQMSEIQGDISQILEKSKDDAYLMIKNLTKWIILKEVDEKYYLARLLEKLIHEINSKVNLVLHVNEEAFGYMPEIVKIVERRVGQLTNTRIEVDYDMRDNGIKLESENTVIDGSLKAQFNTIDKLFMNVGLGKETDEH